MEEPPPPKATEEPSPAALKKPPRQRAPKKPVLVEEPPPPEAAEGSPRQRIPKEPPQVAIPEPPPTPPEEPLPLDLFIFTDSFAAPAIYRIPKDLQWCVARFKQKCQVCLDPIETGTRIGKTAAGWSHLGCALRAHFFRA